MALGMGPPGEYEQTLWTLLAFVARYGHQGVLQAQEMSVRDLTRFAREVGKIVEEENASTSPE